MQKDLIQGRGTEVTLQMTNVGKRIRGIDGSEDRSQILRDFFFCRNEVNDLVLARGVCGAKECVMWCFFFGLVLCCFIHFETDVSRTCAYANGHEMAEQGAMMYEREPLS